jgi:hypothetical protein
MTHDPCIIHAVTRACIDRRSLRKNRSMHADVDPCTIHAVIHALMPFRNGE